MATYVKEINRCVKTQNELIPLAMSTLKPGEIKSREGWLATQLKLMREGMTGRLPEYGPFFKPEKNGFLYPDVNDGWEEVPLWLRGYYPLAVLLEDENMLDTAMQYIEAIFKNATPDGWFGPQYLKEYGKTDNGLPIPDLFPNMLLTDTLILYAESTGDERVCTLLGRYFTFLERLSDEQLLPPIDDGKLRWQTIRAGDLITQLHWYYDKTGEKKALELCTRIYRKIAKSTAGFLSTHAVDFAQRYGYDALYSRQSARREHFERSEFEYEKYKAVFGQTPGGIFIADEQIRCGAIDPRGGYEPCGMVELEKNFLKLADLSGLTLYADRTEDIFFNQFPASFTPDYKQMHYVTASNSPIQSNYTASHTFNSTVCHDRSYQIMTPNNRCCGHNTGMGWPWFTMNLWKKSRDGGLCAFMYAPAEVNTELAGKAVSIKVDTLYPFGDTVKITVLSDASFPLYLRIPEWCEAPECKVNGKAVKEEGGHGNWLRLDNAWRVGDSITLTLPMKIKLKRWAQNGSVSINRGPLTYSVRIKEEYRIVENPLAYEHPEPHLWENYEILPLSPWNYGLVVNDATGECEISVKKIGGTINGQPFAEENSPIVLHARARKIKEWKLQDDSAGELQQGPIFSDEPDEIIELIPMGSARLRIACLPTLTLDESAPRWTPQADYTPLNKRPQGFTYHYDLISNSEKVQVQNTGPWKPDDEK